MNKTNKKEQTNTTEKCTLIKNYNNSTLINREFESLIQKYVHAETEDTYPKLMKVLYKLIEEELEAKSKQIQQQINNAKKQNKPHEEIEKDLMKIMKKGKEATKKIKSKKIKI